MIQAPQTQYIPQQQMMPMGYQQQGVNQSIQYPQPAQGYYYNYPTASCYSQPASGKSQFNGVNIEIINPQGQGLVPQNTCTMPAQYVPVQQTPVMMPAYPQFPASQAIVQAPQVPQTAPVEVAPQPQAAAPVAVPQPQIETPAPVYLEAPAAAVPQQAPVTAAPQQAPVAAAPVVEQPTVATNPAISPESFAGKLNSTDLDAQTAAIEEVAEIVKNNETTAPILLDTQIFDALVGILNKDTSALEGPSPEVIALREKPQDKLSEADKQKAATPSPLEKAEINKQYALYTIAYMQERLNNELEKRNGQTLELKDLPCIENVVETVKSNPNPMLRISGIAALSHIAKPQYKADLTQVFELAKADEDARVKEAAAKAIETLK